jgi:hypothetical protein
MVKKLKPLFVEQSLKRQGIQVFTPLELMRTFSVSLRAVQGFLNDHSGADDGLFMKLKNGVYTVQTHLPPPYLVANKLYTPSYVSLETALSHYRIIPETVYSVTSVTTKTTREFTTPWLVFVYRKIKRSAFTGYTQLREQGTLVLIAEPAKAVADYLYFIDLAKREPNDRMALDRVPQKDVLAYARLFGRESLIRLVRQVYADSKKPRRIY